MERTLSILNIPYKSKCEIHNGDLCTDFIIPNFNANENNGKDYMILECDGPSRFSINRPYQRFGESMAFKRILKGLGWHVVSISCHEWWSLFPNDRQSFLENRLKLG